MAKPDPVEEALTAAFAAALAALNREVSRRLQASGPTFTGDPYSLVTPADWAAIVERDVGPVLAEQVIAAGLSEAQAVSIVKEQADGINAWWAGLNADVGDAVRSLMVGETVIAAGPIDVGVSVVARVAIRFLSKRALNRDKAKGMAQGQATQLDSQVTVATAQNAAGSSSTAGWSKVWRTREDERVRATHADANGQQVPWDTDFTVGGYPGRFPADPRFPAGERIACRCRLTVLDANGAEVTAGYLTPEDFMASNVLFGAQAAAQARIDGHLELAPPRL